VQATQLSERALDIARDAVYRGVVPAIALALVEGGEIAREEHCGFADRAARAPLSSRHLFQAASLAKCLTAWAIARLWEQSRLDLDAPIESYLPRACLPPSSFEHSSITPRHVLGHTAGLSPSDIPGFAPGHAAPALEVRAIAPAGSRFRYSGGGYALLALALEALTGERFAEHMARNVLEPLGMYRTTFDQNSPLADEAATGHDEQGGALPLYRYAAPAAAGLFSTAGDLALFATAHLDGPRGEPPGRGLLAPRTIAMLGAPRVGTERADGLWAQYGLGYEVEVLPGGRLLTGHHGINPGWRALLAIEPARRRAMVALANSDAATPVLDAVLAGWGG